MKTQNFFIVSFFIIRAISVNAQIFPENYNPSKITSEILDFQTNLNNHQFTLVNVFAIWDKYSIMGMDSSQNLVDALNKKVDVKLLGVCVTDEHTVISSISNIADNKKWQMDIYLDISKNIRQIFASEFLPVYLLIDSDRKILYKHVGFSTSVLDTIRSLLVSTGTTSTHNNVSGGPETENIGLKRIHEKYDSIFRKDGEIVFGNKMIVYKNGYSILIDTNDNVISNGNYSFIRPIYYYAYFDIRDSGFMRLSPDFFSVSNGVKWGLINSTGKEVCNCKFEEIVGLFEFEIKVGNAVLNNKEVLIDLSGNIISDTNIYDEIDLFDYSSKLARTLIASPDMSVKCGIIDNQGKAILKCVYDSIFIDSYNFNEEFIVSSNKKWGYFNSFGQPIIPVKYDSINAFTEDCCVVKMNNLYGYYSHSGKIVSDCIYKKAFDFIDGYAPVQDAATNLYGVINVAGEIVIPFSFDSVHYSNQFMNYHLVKKGKEYRISTDGKAIILK